MPRAVESKRGYMLDKAGCLVLRRKRKRLISGGRFAVDKGNRLIWRLNEPGAWRRKYDLPSRIIFTGKWRLNPNYDLELDISEAAGQYKNRASVKGIKSLSRKEQVKGSRLILKGEIISVASDKLAFEIKSEDRRGLIHLQLLKLSGFWAADEFNQIGFMVKKDASPDFLLLKGIWQINQNQQITYTYEKAGMKTKTKTSCVLAFEGFWQINSAHRLTYILAHSADSRFDFRAHLETPNLYPQEGVIKYRLGIGARGQSISREKIVSLYGAWRFSRKAGVIFEMDYGKDKLQKIEFGANIHFNKKDEIIFSLTNKRKEPLGLSIAFTRKFLKRYDAEAFLRLKAFKKQRVIEAGVSIPF